ncbi:MAG: septal ring lytic transglycosylase RlpA family protein [Nitrospiraceae bacterium]|nr:septal ring lytic transglycosylase RlpA family protein [Nitrospiraceae bacterium]
MDKTVTHRKVAVLVPAWLVLFSLPPLFMAGCAVLRARRPAGETCMASWYGREFIGRLTASGRRLSRTGRTAAHPALPFGTVLKVTNLSSGASTIVTVNDRGPFRRGRCLDLSYRAARDIGLIRPGSGLVRLVIIGRDPSYSGSVRYGPGPGRGPYTIQAGSFHELADALRLKSVLRINYEGVRLDMLPDPRGRALYRVDVGTFADKKAAGLVASRLAGEGYSVSITKYKRR